MACSVPQLRPAAARSSEALLAFVDHQPSPTTTSCIPILTVGHPSSPPFLSVPLHILSLHPLNIISFSTLLLRVTWSCV